MLIKFLKHSKNIIKHINHFRPNNLQWHSLMLDVLVTVQNNSARVHGVADVVEGEVSDSKGVGFQIGCEVREGKEEER